MLLAKIKLMGGSIISKTRNHPKIGFPLKPDDPDDVIVISSNVHELKGKPRFIV